MNIELCNWGHYPKIKTVFESLPLFDYDKYELTSFSSMIARGNGRCYGDSALNSNLVLSSLNLNKFVSFDAENGELVCLSGVLLSDIIDCFVPRGWFLPVTPGTKLITIGGAVASDVHGKNHHIAATFSQHVKWIDILTAENGVVRCSPKQNSDLFYATCGGQGLTGIILKVCIHLIKISSSLIKQISVKAPTLNAIMDAFEEYSYLPYSVAWIDCLKQGKNMGRSFFMGGDFAKIEELPKKKSRYPYELKHNLKLTVPFNFPNFALNPLSIKAFNSLYYFKAKNGTATSFQTIDTFFYPLDSINNWNRIYGKRGFLQYQFVLPKGAVLGIPKILERIARSSLGSFLAVLKLCGKQPLHEGNLSFPQEGYSLALDFPISNKLFPLLNELDRMVIDFGGRLYLAKDSRTNEVNFKEFYKNKVDEFLAIKSKWDPMDKFTSLQAKRVGLVLNK